MMFIKKRCHIYITLKIKLRSPNYFFTDLSQYIDFLSFNKAGGGSTSIIDKISNIGVYLSIYY